jgi:hypothetical protein
MDLHVRGNAALVSYKQERYNVEVRLLGLDILNEIISCIHDCISRSLKKSKLSKCSALLCELCKCTSKNRWMAESVKACTAVHAARV